MTLTLVAVRRILIPAGLIGIICYVAFDVVQELQQLQSISGNVIFIIGLYVTSKHPSRVRISMLLCSSQPQNFAQGNFTTFPRETSNIPLRFFL